VASQATRLTCAGRFFSQAVSTTDTRQTFVNNILTVYNEFNIDGIDIDWEYPGQTGESGNVVTPDDTKNFLLFLKLLKLTLPPDARITAATQSQPFAGPDGDPLSDMSAFADVLDWILLMNYDVWGCKGLDLLHAYYSK
jgi:chitinase